MQNINTRTARKVALAVEGAQQPTAERAYQGPHLVIWTTDGMEVIT